MRELAVDKEFAYRRIDVVTQEDALAFIHSADQQHNDNARET